MNNGIFEWEIIIKDIKNDAEAKFIFGIHADD